MTNNYNNRRRALAEIVSVEAWHDEFTEPTLKVALHVDVVFETGRIGGEEESPVRFRLNLKQADIVVVIPESEPLGVQKKSVSRDAPHIVRTIAETIELSSEASVETCAASERRLMSVTQSITPDGHYRWSLRPCLGPVLQGRPWNAHEAPRLTIVDQRKDRTKGIPPAVRVEVRCKREDLEISEIVLKDGSVLERVKNKVGFRNKLAAAEAYIRDRLAREGLLIKNIKESFGEIVLASTVAEPQKVN